jgi:hypothetical protein
VLRGGAMEDFENLVDYSKDKILEHMISINSHVGDSHDRSWFV